MRTTAPPSVHEPDTADPRWCAECDEPWPCLEARVANLTDGTEPARP